MLKHRELHTLFMYVCSKRTARLCHSLTEMQNMQDSYLKCFCGLIFIDIVHSASRFKCTEPTFDEFIQTSTHSALYGKFHYMTAFRDSARIFRIADIIVDCDLLQLQQRLLLLYL